MQETTIQLPRIAEAGRGWEPRDRSAAIRHAFSASSQSIREHRGYPRCPTMFPLEAGALFLSFPV